MMIYLDDEVLYVDRELGPLDVLRPDGTDGATYNLPETAVELWTPEQAIEWARSVLAEVPLSKTGRAAVDRALDGAA